MSFLMMGCASIFIPKRQLITIKTPSTDSKIYVDNVLFGTGEVVTSKILKNGASDVVIKTPNCLDNHKVLMPVKRPDAYWPLQVLNLLNLGLGFAIDPIFPKNAMYDKVFNFSDFHRFTHKSSNEKYINLTNIGISLKDKDKDWCYLTSIYKSNNLTEHLNTVESSYYNNEIKKELKSAAKGNTAIETLDDPNGDKLVELNDTRFTESSFKTLKKNGYIDTLNKFFIDYNNTIFLEGTIKKIVHFQIFDRKFENSMFKCKPYITWHIKNMYNEILDSVITSVYSDDFLFKSYYGYHKKSIEIKKLVYSSSIDLALIELQKNERFKSYLKIDTLKKGIPEKSLILNRDSSLYITDKNEAFISSVIVKTKNGHGSGFAIAKDGYIITNYHVISKKSKNLTEEITVITNDNQEYKAQIVSSNKNRDLAILKISKKFEKVFKLSDKKSFKNLQEVYTIGAPKSVELGQSISIGLISNERNVNNNYLLQLSMSVNSGNSGGPVFDSNGNLHGLIVSKAIGENTEGIAFAIPSHVILEYLNIKLK